MEQTLTTHPLAQTLARGHALNAYLKAECGLPAGPEWITPSALWAAGSPHLAAMIEAQQRRLRTRAVSVIGSALLQGYQWQIIANTLVCYLAARRVPSLDHGQLRVRRNAEQEVEAVAFGGEHFLTLPDDLDAGHPGAEIVPDTEALRTALREQLEAHFAWVIARICAEVGGKPRGLWLNVADSLAGDLAWLARLLRPETPLAALEAEVAQLLGVPGSPLAPSRVGLFELTYRERSEVFLDRATCCFWYKTVDGDYCSTCPKRTPEDRNTRLLQYLAEEYDKQQAPTGAAQPSA